MKKEKLRIPTKQAGEPAGVGLTTGNFAPSSTIQKRSCIGFVRLYTKIKAFHTLGNFFPSLRVNLTSVITQIILLAGRRSTTFLSQKLS